MFYNEIIKKKTLPQAYLSCLRVHFEAMSSLKGLESVTARKKKKKNVSKRFITKLLKKHTPPSLPFVSKSPFQSNVISESSATFYRNKKKKKNVSKRSITKLIKKKHSTKLTFRFQ